MMMRQPVVNGVKRIALIVLLGTLLPKTQACLCVTKHRYAQLSDIDSHEAIFTARVLYTKNQMHTLVVTERFKGRIPDTVLYQVKGDCSRFLESSFPGDMADGEWLIFTESIGNHRMIDIGLCSGSHLLLSDHSRRQAPSPDVEFELGARSMYDAQQTELELLRSWRATKDRDVGMSEMAIELGSLKDSLEKEHHIRRWATGLVVLLGIVLLGVIWRTRKLVARLNRSIDRS